MILRNQSARPGETIISAIATTSKRMKGIVAFQISAIVVSAGATPYIINRLRPNGGDTGAISMLIRNMAPYQRRSYPKAIIKGKVIEFDQST